jgi:hypothetical protein
MKAMPDTSRRAGPLVLAANLGADSLLLNGQQNLNRAAVKSSTMKFASLAFLLIVPNVVLSQTTSSQVANVPHQAEHFAIG